ncbi:hypothetical protein [Pseudoalteromonas rubra]|uniref:Ig-like domain-containing protein n=1 Tax=Pseudoalteromonas rubra TaxID=43658 RepID=A0A5S3WXX0_9GAMM|nr:hypothetical protein [Pseudoalteromonas rubra]TMP35045.1 hypothetical protein CWB98_17155 [Pseudoalteromonas rubra]
MEFQQEHAPIRVRGITTFFPIERAPDAPIYVSVQPNDTGDKLVWSAVDSAKFYSIEQYINGKWEMVNASYRGTQYTLPKSASGVYRVTACDEYGCAAAKEQNRVVSEPFAIKAFYSDRSQVDMFGQVKVHWQISGAAMVSVSRVENGSTVKTWPIVNPQKGTLSSQINHLSLFKLTAYDFNGQATTRTLAVATLPENPIMLDGVKGEYHQPYFLSGLDVVEHSVLENEDNLFFATHNQTLHRYSVIKEGGKIVDWKPEWKISLPGVVNNAPAISNGDLIFSVSMFNGTGQVYRARLSDGKITQRSKVTNSNLIASPLIVKPKLSTSARAFRAASGVFTSTTEVQGGIYVFHRDGLIQILHPDDLEFVVSEYRVSNMEMQFINTPSLVIEPSSRKQQLIMQKDDEMFGVDVPTLTSPSVIENTMEQLFGSDQAQPQTDKAGQKTQTLPVVWRKKL